MRILKRCNCLILMAIFAIGLSLEVDARENSLFENSHLDFKHLAASHTLDSITSLLSCAGAGGQRSDEGAKVSYVLPIQSD